MKKNSVPVWVIVICVLGVLFYLSMFLFDGFGLNTLKYEVDTDGTILLNKEKFTISSGITSYYDETTDAFYVEGIFNNNTEKKYYEINLDFVIYDLDGNVLGNAYAYLERINGNESWKFKARYDDIDSTDAVSYKLVDVSYYR